MAFFCLAVPLIAWAQLAETAASPGQRAEATSGESAAQGMARRRAEARLRRERQFLAGRQVDAALRQAGSSPALRLMAARRQHLALARALAMAAAKESSGTVASLSANWQAVGPSQISSALFGEVTGRVTSIAIDPSDASGNTVYLGTTGGGVWKSVNAAGPVASATFAPLTDTLPVFSANAGTPVIPSLSIGAVSVQPGGTGIVLAGTGDPNDALDSYYGTGLLRSADNGLTWSIVQNSHDGVAGNHSFVGEGFAGFAWSSATPGLVVAAVSQAARGQVVNASNAGYSVQGIYYSSDAGITWQMATIQDGAQVVQSAQSNFASYEGNPATAVVWNAVRQKFYAAVRFHGYYESADGMTWTRLANQPGANLTAANCPVNANNPGSPACPIFRGALAAQAQTGDMFALTVDLNNQDQGLWQDVCAKGSQGCASATVSFATRLNAAPLEAGPINPTIAQGDYDLWLAALPAGSASTTAGDTLLLVGTEDIYRCTLAAGCALRNTTNSNSCAAAEVAGSQHAVDGLAAPSGTAEPLLYFGNDGGLWRSADGVDQQASVCSVDDALHFQNLNGGVGSLAEVVSVAEHPTDATQVIVGVGANGSASSTGTISATSPWEQLSTGEGGVAAIDPANPLNWYLTTGAGVSITQCTNGGACAPGDFTGVANIGAPQVSNDEALLDAPYILDPALPANVIVGTCRVWRGPGSGGTGWSASNVLSSMLDGAQQSACSGNALVRSLAAGGPFTTASSMQNSGSEVLYAGMAGLLDGGGAASGHLFTTTTANTASGTSIWTDLYRSQVTNDAANTGQFNPGGFDVSSIFVDPHDTSGKTVYATVMGFSGSGVSAPHVYASSDGGVHWANISGNLPNAPANSVLVDPNDANTVYVAMDTGVYATQQVSTCSTPTVNCWTVFGVGLPNAPAMELGETLATNGSGGVPELRVATYGRGVWEIPLRGPAAAGPSAAMTLTPASLTFGNQQVQTLSSAQTISVANMGNAPLTVTRTALIGNFTETDNCVSSSPIAAGSDCQAQVTFLPSGLGTRAGTITFYGNVSGGQAQAVLTGTGTAGASVVLDPLTLTFGNTNVGSTSAAQNITISNTSGATVALQTPVVSGDFVLSANTCGASLGPSVGCTVSIVFKPTATGSRSGTFSITDGVGTQTAALSGTGYAPATDTLAPLSLGFGAQQLNTASPAQQVTLTNTGDAALTLIAAQVVAGDFTAVNGCGNSLAGHASCSISVSFLPKNVGAGNGSMTVADAFKTQTVALSGTGIAPAGVSLAPSQLMDFGTTSVGVASAPQIITLTNNGGEPLVISGAAASGDFALLQGQTTCPVGSASGLAVNASCAMQVQFRPSAGGVRSGALAVTDNAPGSPQSLRLTGIGVDFQWASNGQTSATVASGQAAAYSLTLAPPNGTTGLAAGQAVASLACAGAPAHAVCSVSPQTADLSTATTVIVTVGTGVQGAFLQYPAAPEGWPSPPARRRLPLDDPGGAFPAWLAAAFPFGLLQERRRVSRRRRERTTSEAGCCSSSRADRRADCSLKRGMEGCFWLVLGAMLFSLAGCGTGRLIPGGTSGGGGSGTPALPTPSGTYNITVTATYSGLVKAQHLVLIVQ
ncbi:MAG: choice-of-anchor D domain-containing protein [Acidobacteriaceae bacterium]